MEDNKTVFIKAENLLIKMDLDNIYFFTKYQNKVVAVTTKGIIEANNTLYNISNTLNNNKHFIRTHKSFIVNCRLINSISKYTQNTYIIGFNNTKQKAFMTKANLKLLQDRFLVI